MFDSMELVTIKKLAGKVTQPIDPEFLPPGYGGGGVSSWNDIPDRPFGTEIGEAVILDNRRIQFTDGEAVMTPIGLVVGKTYTVEWNEPGGVNTTVNCVAVESIPGSVIIGNVGLILDGDDTGEPFIIGDMPSEGMAVAMSITGANAAFVTIRGEAELVHYLDAKFVPGGLVKVIDFVMHSNGEEFSLLLKGRSVGELDEYINPAAIYRFVNGGNQVIGRLEYNGEITLFNLCHSTLETACFTSTLPNGDGLRVYEMNFNTSLGDDGKLTQHNISSTKS